MASLAETIANVTDPTPKILDPEDDINTETVAKVSGYNEDTNTGYENSLLRSQTAPLLEDIDPKYAGRKVTRKSLDDIFHKDDKLPSSIVEESDKDSETSSVSENSSIFDESLDENLSDEALSNFKKIVQIQSISNSVTSDQELDHEDEESSVSSDVEEQNEDEDRAHQLSNVDLTSEIEKGNAIKAQQEIWNRLCESRIKLQKLLILANKLPQFDSWQVLKEKGGKQMAESLNTGTNCVKNLLHNWLDLQQEIVIRNPEVKQLEENSESPNYNPDKNESYSDEEISSDIDENMEEVKDHVKSEGKEMGKVKNSVESRRKAKKRKLKNEDFEEILAKRHKSLIPYRNSVLQKWDEKTRISTGRVTQKSFAAFDNSALKQIEQILQDKARLIKRTQLKRSAYRVLGKSDENAEEPESKQDILLKDYDEEIFDDDDFYRQILKDVIESRSVGIDPAILRKQMEIQKIRNKMKRKVDTKASKGRKLRYDVHPKLVNFMAPVQTSSISDEARENLLKCLFGRGFS